MRGNITRRGKTSWRIKFDAEPDALTGKRRIRYVTVKGKRADAEAELARLLNDAHKGTLVDASKLTVEEYLSRPWKSRLGYRLFRSPVVMFGIGPIWSLMIGPRIWSKKMRPRQRRSVIVTNLALALLVAAIAWLVQIPTAVLAGTLGVFMFYVQHQFEDVYWETSDQWSYADAALQGSSYLKLPKLFQYFTGNIGLHHVHHLSAKIPNYNLQRAHDESPIFRKVPILGVGDGLRAIRLKVIDRQSGRLLTWREVKSRA